MRRGLLTRLLITAAPTFMLVAIADRWLAVVTNERAGAVFAVVADPSVPIRHLVLGSSHAVRSVDPAVIDRPGVAFWNVALEGAGPAYTRRWYAFYRRHRPAPAEVVLVEPWFVFRSGALWRTWEHDGEHLPWPELWSAARQADGRLPALAFNLFPFLKYRDRLLEGLPEDAHRGERYRAARGFDPFPAGQWVNWKPPPEYLAADDPDAVAALAGLLDDLRADHARVTLVSLPTYGPLTPPHASSDASVRRLAEERGIRLLDYQADARLALAGDAAAFRDWSHLNLVGSRRLNARLAADLAGS